MDRTEGSGGAAGYRAQPGAGPDRPAALVAVPHADDHRARRGMGSGRAGDPDRQHRRPGAPAHEHTEPHLTGRRFLRHDLSARRGRRRPGLRPALRQVRTAQAVHRDARALSAANGLTAFSFNYGDLPDFFRFVAGHGNRRRVRRDPLGDRRADPRASTAAGSTSRSAAPTGSARSSASLSEYLLLNHSLLPTTSAGGSASSSGRSSAWRSGGCAVPSRRARAGSSCTVRPRRPRRRSRRSSARSSVRQQLKPVDEDKYHRDQAAGVDLVPAGGADPLQAVPQAVPARRDPDDQPVVPVQRDLLHVRRSCSSTSTGSPTTTSPTYFFAFAAGNLLGPLLIGRLFDTIGRKQMISSTYLLSGCAARASAATCSTSAR